MHPGLPPVGSSKRAMLRRAQDGPASDSQPRLRRQRNQQQRSAEYDWSDSEEEQEAASSSDEDEEWGQEDERSENLLLADSAGAWRTPDRSVPAASDGARADWELPFDLHLR